MPHKGPLKARYFPDAWIGDMKHHTVPMLMKQAKHIILHNNIMLHIITYNIIGTMMLLF